MDNIVVSTSPHVKTAKTTKKIMIDVLIALLPAAIMGIVYFGVPALIIELVAIVFAVASEFVYAFIAKGGFANKCKNAGRVCLQWLKSFDFTSMVTGLILALILPPTATWYQTAIGSVFSIVIVKMLFGGTGKNLVNPAATGRVMMFISFALTTYVACNFEPISLDSDLFTGATYLSGSLLGNKGESMHLVDLFLGTGLAGCIGETCKAAILLGAIYLTVRGVIKWWQPLAYIATAFVIALFINQFNALTALELTLSGGLIFGAVFMATDYVTSPKGFLGQIIYYVFLGVLTATLRHFTNIEVVSFVIMLGNLITPLLDNYIVRKPFGYHANKEAKQ